MAEIFNPLLLILAVVLVSTGHGSEYVPGVKADLHECYHAAQGIQVVAEGFIGRPDQAAIDQQGDQGVLIAPVDEGAALDRALLERALADYSRQLEQRGVDADAIAVEKELLKLSPRYILRATSLSIISSATG